MPDGYDDFLGNLSDEQIAAFLELRGINDRRARLDDQLAQAQAFMNRPSQPHSTWAGSLAGGVGDLARAIGGGLRARELRGEQEGLTKETEGKMRTIVDLLRQRGGSAPAAAPSQDFSIGPSPVMATATPPPIPPPMEDDALASVSPPIDLSGGAAVAARPAAPARMPIRPRKPMAPAAASAPDPIVAFQAGIRQAGGPEAFFSNPANAALGPLWSNWTTAGAQEVTPGGGDIDNLKAQTSRAAEALRQALRRKGG